MLLEFGYHSDLEIREVSLSLDLAAGFSILYISDLHFNRFAAPIVANLIAIIEEKDPDLILLGGDYVDTNNGLRHFTSLLLALKRREHVYAIAGNHDYFFGINQIQEALQQQGIEWLEKASVRIRINGNELQLDGSWPVQSGEGADVQILFLHEPQDIPMDNNPYDLVLAGHLHGSQVVCWQNKHGLFPGRLFYKWNVLQKQLGNCLYLVSKGVSDTLPVRFYCRRDVLFIQVRHKTSKPQ